MNVDGSARLSELFAATAEDRFPEADGEVEVFPLTAALRETDVQGVVVEFTGHAVVLGDVSREAAIEHGADGFGGASASAMLELLCADNGVIGYQAVVYVGLGEGAEPVPRTEQWNGHPRVRRALSKRTDVAVFGDDVECVTLGRGLGARLEIGVEVLAQHRRAALGTTALERVRRAVGVGEPVFGAAAPGNVRAARALLAAGFHPVAFEVVIETRWRRIRYLPLASGRRL